MHTGWCDQKFMYNLETLFVARVSYLAKVISEKPACMHAGFFKRKNNCQVYCFCFVKGATHFERSQHHSAAEKHSKAIEPDPTSANTLADKAEDLFQQQL